MKHKKRTSYCIYFVLVTIPANKIRGPIYVKLVTKKEYSDNVGLFTTIQSRLLLNLHIKRIFLGHCFNDDSIIKFLHEIHLECVIATRRGLVVKKSLVTIQECLKQLADFQV